MNHQSIKVLVVEDDPAYAGLLREVLIDFPSSPFEVTHVTRLSEALPRLAEAHWDVVLLDLMLPDREGLATYSETHAAAPAVPIIVVTGFDDQHLALQAVREGAQDYLIKGQFEAKILARVIHYAIERKRAAEALRQSEEFFRLISENVHDLIAVIGRDGRRLYNSPSYKDLLGDPAGLMGTDSFNEIHPEDREMVKQIFQQTLLTGIGVRAEYRMLLRSGHVRYIESQGSAIHDEAGTVSKVVVVSRDITERIEAMAQLRKALSDLEKSHAELKAAQAQLIQAEELEAVSAFAAGVAHEVMNPLQTVILGVDYLASHVAAQDATAASVLADMGTAVMRADGIVRGLLEFSATNKREVKAEDLSGIVAQSLRLVEQELANSPIILVKDLAPALPPVRLEAKTMKHVFTHLIMHAVRELPEGGKLIVRTFTRLLTEDFSLNGRPPALFRTGETVVGAAIENIGSARPGSKATQGGVPDSDARPILKETGLGLTVLEKIIELYGGAIETTNDKAKGKQHTVLFKADRKE